MKKLTLEQFVKKAGSQESAAHAIGVALQTVNRWMNRGFKPRGKVMLDRLREVGIRIG